MAAHNIYFNDNIGKIYTEYSNVYYQLNRKPTTLTLREFAKKVRKNKTQSIRLNNYIFTEVN